MKKKTVEERVSELEWLLCQVFENRIAIIETRLDRIDKVKWIPVIDLPESAKKIVEEKSFHKEGKV